MRVSQTLERLGRLARQDRGPEVDVVDAVWNRLSDGPWLTWTVVRRPVVWTAALSAIAAVLAVILAWVDTTFRQPELHEIAQSIQWVLQ